MRDKIPTIEHIVLIEADGAGDDVVRYADLIAAEPADLAAEAETATLDDIATIIYTSGTTGPPKGVMLSHSNVAWTLESVGQSMRDQTDIDDFAGKRHVSYLPMAHVMERLLGHYYMVDFATRVFCCPETAQMPAMVRESKPERVHRRSAGVGEDVRRRQRRALRRSGEGAAVQRRRRRGGADHGEDDPGRGDR